MKTKPYSYGFRLEALHKWDEFLKTKPSGTKAEFSRKNNLKSNTFGFWATKDRKYIEQWAPKYPQALTKYEVEGLEFVNTVQSLMPVKEEDWLKLNEIYKKERSATWWKEKLRLMKFPEAVELRDLLSPMQEQNPTQYQRAVATTKRLYSNEEIHHKGGKWKQSESTIKKRMRTKKALYGDEEFNNEEQRQRTNVRLYGVKNVSHVKEKMKKAIETRFSRYGRTSTESERKLRETMRRIHGRLFNIGSFSRRSLTWNNQEFKNLQGFEDYALCVFDVLEFKPEEVRSQAISFSYTKSSGGTGTYIPDLVVEKEVIEVKSCYTLDQDVEFINKAEGVTAAGYRYTLWLMKEEHKWCFFNFADAKLLKKSGSASQYLKNYLQSHPDRLIEIPHDYKRGDTQIGSNLE